MMRPLEDQLRSLIDGGVSPVTADEAQRRATPWERAGRGRRGGARHRRIAVVVALTMALIAGAAFLVVGTGHDTTVRVQSSGPSPSPTGEVVAVTSDGRLVVLASGDGHIVRVLANDAVAQGKDADGSTSLSVTPDGQTVYFMRQPAGCVGCASIASVPVGGGPITNPIGQGCCIREPTVSPDGHWLAFTGVPGKSDAGGQILLRDLTMARPPQAHVYDRLWNSGATLNVGIGPIFWAPDSRHLAFVQNDTPGGTPPRVLDTSASQSILLDRLRPVLIKGADGMSWAGYLGTTGQMLAVSNIGDRPGQSLTAEHKPLRVVAIDPTTGNTTRVLFTLAGASQPIADATGTHIVIQGAEGVYRWSRGDRQPTKIADHVLAATWLPAAPSPPPSPTPAGDGHTREVKLVTAHGTVWALVFAPSPLLPNTSVKIVWRIRGSGRVSLAVHDPHGKPIPLTFGPERHPASTWNRPGDEFGSGFLPNVPGRWSVTIRRRNVQATLYLVVDSPVS
jgi:WD40-like Beta Propeller Repeat